MLKKVNKIFANLGLMGVLALILSLPIISVGLAGFTNTGEKSVVLSSQDERTNQQQIQKPIPEDINKIIQRIEEEMAKEATQSTE